MHPTQRILVATNLGPASKPAVSMAMRMANKGNATVRLMHVYHVPAPGSNVIIRVSDVIQERVKRTMAQQVAQLKEEFPGVSIEPILTTGQPTVMLRRELKKEPYDLLVLGGNSSDLMDKESHGTAALLTDVAVPTLIVPHNFSKDLEDIRKPVLAVDLNHPNLEGHLERVWNWSKYFRWDDVHVVHVQIDDDSAQFDEATVLTPLSKIYDGAIHETTIKGGSPESELIAFGERTEADLFLLLQEPKSYLTAITSKGVSRSMVEKSQIPVFIIP